MNIYDIAKESGVSVSTVSRVLNNKDNVSKKTRALVEAVLKKHNYTPNAMARGLVANSMKTIGVLTVDIRDPHYANTAYTIEQEFNKLGYNVILCNTGMDNKVNAKYIKVLSEKKVDGIILVGSVFNNNEIKSSLLSYLHKIPIVLANGCLNIENAHSVLVDDSYGISLCVDYLYEKKHTDIIYVKDNDTYSADQKEQGYLTTMAKHNLPVDLNSVIHVQRGLDGGQEAIEKLMNSKKSFSAIIFGEDITAIGGIKRLKKFGLSVPDDVAITGFNNSIFAEASEPELTSIDNNVEAMGELSVRMLHDLIEDKKSPQNILIRPSLNIRKST